MDFLLASINENTVAALIDIYGGIVLEKRSHARACQL
jgi:hypothetical protein